MASISTQANGLRTVQFIGMDRKRRSIRLGRCSDTDVLLFKSHVEELVLAQEYGRMPNAATMAWLDNIGAVTKSRLIGVHLISGCGMSKKERDKLAKQLVNQRRRGESRCTQKELRAMSKWIAEQKENEK